MRNIFLIAKEDFKSLTKNAISILVIVGLICISSVYAWINIAAAWDPYKNTQELQIAVSNEDQGCTSKYLPIEINMGKEVVSNLYENRSFKWVFVDTDTAMEGLNNGDYYAAIVIPESFSKDMMSILTTDAESAELYYIRNEKINSLAPKVTEKGATAIQQQINNSFTSSLLEALLKMFNLVSDTVQSKDAQALASDVINTLGTTSAALSTSASQLRQLETTITSLNETLETLKGVLPQSGSAKEAELRAKLVDANSKLQEGKKTLAELTEFLKQIGAYDESKEVIDELNSLLDQMISICGSAEGILNQFDGTASSMNNTINALESLTTNLNGGLQRVADDFDLISSDLNKAKEKLQALSGSTTLEDLKKIVGDDPVSFSSKMTKPVQFDREAYFSVANNGSAMAPFYISLAIWIGCSLIGTIVTVELSKKRLAKLNKKAGEGREIKRYQIFFGRYITFGVISLLQTLLICLGALFFLRIQCVYPVNFLISAIVLSLAYSFFIYTLVVSFGNVGKALAVIFLVLQVACSGGIFPFVMLTDIFSSLYPFMPFSWSIKAFKYCIAGFTTIDGVMMWLYVTVMPFIVLTVISLLLGLVFRVPIIKFNEFMLGKLKETHLVG